MEEIVMGAICLSLATEWIENPVGDYVKQEIRNRWDKSEIDGHKSEIIPDSRILTFAAHN
ncbi:MAG: hypothetical protein LBN27_04580 [Prevotellaceae bacterium]|jgi:hypothetical protein|nr:hypothetical protein [Prevotellaceae bacterium]